MQMKYFNSILLAGFVLLSISCKSDMVQTGLDNVGDYSHLFENKRVGIVTNHTAYSREGQHIIDVFFAMENVEVTALFGPEHGIRGDEEAGAEIDSVDDPMRNIPIYSLYGQTRKPTPEMLAEVDVLIFDIQDVGARYYTYIYTMALAMEAAAEQGKAFVVLDRPNPINGVAVEGNILDPEFATFVGLYALPVRHGMTVGELATMFNEEGWLQNGVRTDLTVAPMKNWQRTQWYDETGLRFRKPSPNIPNLQVATVYPGTCLLEGANVSEGRGTETPFLIFGAPWIDSENLTTELNKLNLPGLDFMPTTFIPKSIPGMATNPKYENRKCFGCEAVVTNRETFEPYWTGIQIINTLQQMYPDSLQWRVRHFDRLCGTALIREAILNGDDLEELRQSWQPEMANFMVIREKYLLYD